MTAIPPCCSVRRYLAETRNFSGTAYMVFQPAEEGGGGGEVMVKEGLFERFPADEVYAVHNWPGLPAGQMAVRAGPVMAATDEVQITLRGRGGHGAMPQLVVDPVVAAAQVISALQTIASRNVSPLDSVGEHLLHADEPARRLQRDPRARAACGHGTASDPKPVTSPKNGCARSPPSADPGCSADVSYTRGYPATINSAREAQFAARVGSACSARAT